MEPINYDLNVATPFASAMQGYQAGAAIRNDQQQQAAMAQQRYQQQQQSQVIKNLISNPNASAQDYANATLIIPGMREQFKQAYDQRSAEQQQSHLSDTAQYFAAVKGGNSDLAINMMNKKADAMAASGVDPKQVQALRMNAQTMQIHPELSRSIIGMMLSSIPGGDKVISGASGIGTEDRASAEAPMNLATKRVALGTAQAEGVIKSAEAAVAPEKVRTDIANTQSQIADRAKRLGLDADKLQTETQIKLQEMAIKTGELPEYVAKDVTAAASESISSAASADKMNQLASKLDAAAVDLGSGVTARVGEAWKRTFGTQNDLTRIRSEFSRIVTPAAMAAYKKVATGSTSDKDIETAMIGVPKDTDSPDRMSSFLRGAAKLQVYDSVLNNAKSEWLQSVRTLGKSTRDIEVDGVRVPAGTTFKAFSDQYVEKKVKAQLGASVVKTRDYMQYADPGTSSGGGMPGGH